MRMTIRETTVCQICPLNFTCDHIGSTIERIAILKALVLFFGLKNKGKVTSDLPPLVVFGLPTKRCSLTVAMQMVRISVNAVNIKPVIISHALTNLKKKTNL